jgi:hypothetical protein
MSSVTGADGDAGGETGAAVGAGAFGGGDEVRTATGARVVS